MKTIINLIKADLIIANGDKNNMKTLFILFLLLLVGTGIAITPLFTIILMLMFTMGFVSMVFQLQSQNHCENMFSLLPIERKDLVRARFLFTGILYILLSVFAYLIMLLSLELNIYEKVCGISYDPLLKELGIRFTFRKICHLAFLAEFALGLGLTAFQLRQYFKNSQIFSNDLLDLSKIKKSEFIITFLFFMAFIIIFLSFSGEIVMSMALSLMIQLLLQLINAADGNLLIVVMLVISSFEVAFQYICTILEYDAKEL